MLRRTHLTRDFFKLEGDSKELDQTAFVALLKGKPALCENLLYKPDTLENPYQSGRFRVKGVTFRNFSFSHTLVTGFEFTDCIFERCLFIATIFRDCRFTSGDFLDCNPHRIEFKDCYVDPKNFDKCISDNQFSNIGVYLFQELLRNSRQQAQPEFSDEAQYCFKKWERRLLWREISRSKSWLAKIWLGRTFVGLHLFNWATGSGMRLGRLTVSSLVVLLLFTLINWKLAVQMGLMQDGHVIGSFVDAFYFSTVITTTLGFGDISPTTSLGRLVVSGEAIIGFVLFALLTSTMYRKFTS